MAKACKVCHGSGQTFIEFRTKRKPYWKDCAVCDGLGLLDASWIRTKGGIDHVLTSSNGNWHHTACRSLWSAGEQHTEPKRRCRNCLREIKKGRPWRDSDLCPRSMAAFDA